MKFAVLLSLLPQHSKSEVRPCGCLTDSWLGGVWVEVVWCRLLLYCKAEGHTCVICLSKSDQWWYLVFEQGPQSSSMYNTKDHCSCCFHSSWFLHLVPLHCWVSSTSEATSTHSEVNITFQCCSWMITNILLSTHTHGVCVLFDFSHEKLFNSVTAVL